jgi:DNA-binding transcriptional ArsR family regulator
MEPNIDVYKAISDPTRRAILDRLRLGPVGVTSLASGFEQSRPGISKHLRVLRECGLVQERRAGRERVYELLPLPLGQVSQWLDAYRVFWQSSLGNLKTHLEKNK